MRVLGIDCGSEFTGFGVVEELPDRRLICHTNGAIKSKSGTAMAAKLEKIFSELTAIIGRHQPEIVAIEDVFYAVNVKTALKLGQVRGVAMLAASSAGLEVAEYSPLSIKSAVVGYGRADKLQVQQMVTRLLGLAAPRNQPMRPTRWLLRSATSIRLPPTSGMRPQGDDDPAHILHSWRGAACGAGFAGAKAGTEPSHSDHHF